MVHSEDRHVVSPEEASRGSADFAALRGGDTSLGIELGSTRIKACLIGPGRQPLAQGSHAWENRWDDGMWTYSLEEVWEGLRASVRDLLADYQQHQGAEPLRIGALGISAMMHGYLVFDAAGNQLVPFRTWRNTTTERAAEELSRELDFGFPLRWSASHLYQAVLDAEPHVQRLGFMTTLAGYVHWMLTGRKVLGIGDASGIFPIDPETLDYDAARLEAFDALVSARAPGIEVASLLPEVLVAGQLAGALTEEGAARLDPSGTLKPGIPLCPPEGDAGTGMVATNAVSPRTGNVSAGTSIFSMVVLDSPLSQVHPEVDVVTTPAGDPVAMVHCNNGASELNVWAGVFAEFAAAMGLPDDPDAVFEALFRAALRGAPDGGGLLAYNHLSGEPIVGLQEGRPLVVRTPDSKLDLATFMRTQLYSVFATLSLGMRTLAEEGVILDSVFAHGGLFRTPGVAQRLLAAAIDTPVAVGATAGEGGAWGMAVLADFLRFSQDADLGSYLRDLVFADADPVVLQPDPVDVAGFGEFLARYSAGLAVERAAVTALP